MNCQKCNSQRLGGVTAHCRDLFVIQIGDQEREGYVDEEYGIGNGDAVEFDYCLDCGQIQGQFPLPPTEIEKVAAKKAAAKAARDAASPEMKAYAEQFLDIYDTGDGIRIVEHLLTPNDPSKVIFALQYMRNHKSFKERDVNFCMNLISEWDHYQQIEDAVYPDDDVGC